MAVIVRPAVPGDAGPIRNVGLQTWPGTYESFAGADYVEHGLATWWSEQATLRSITDTTVLVAEDDGVVVGMVNLGDLDGVPVIWKLYVLPEHQGKGIGSSLLSTVLQTVPAGSSRVILEYVDGNEPATRFYKSRGFTEFRREPNLPGWPDTVWMDLAVGPGPT